MEIKRRLAIWYRILVRPFFVFVFVYLLGSLGILQSIRDEFLPPVWQERLLILNLIPDWPWFIWALLALMITILVILESSFRQIRDLENQKGEKAELDIKFNLECAPPRYAEAWVSLRVINNSTKPITNCYVYLISASRKSDGYNPLTREGEHLAWSSHNKPLYGDKIIPAKENQLADIIRTIHDENRIMFTIQEARDLYKDKATIGDYLIELGITGIFEGERFNETATAQVTYTGDMNLSCEMIE